MNDFERGTKRIGMSQETQINEMRQAMQHNKDKKVSMTPHPQQEYILTEEEIGCIETALESDEHCKKCPYEGGGFNQSVASFLRSRPHSSAQSEQQIREKVLREIESLIVLYGTSGSGYWIDKFVTRELRSKQGEL